MAPAYLDITLPKTLAFTRFSEVLLRSCWSDAPQSYSDAMPDSELKLISRIRRMAGKSSSVVSGIGDDAAVLRLPRGHDVLVTTDFSIEKIHFRTEWHHANVVGWRCLTRGLSDIAAMGGEPRAAFLSLAVAGDVSQKWVDNFFRGLLKLAKQCNVPLAGGDTAEAAAGIQADIVVVGSVPKGKAVLRSGAKAGEQIYVTGHLGGSAMALSRLRQGASIGSEYAAHFRPVPRVAVGRWLREHKIPGAMIDLSDGLSTDLQHICKESHVGAEINVEAIPRARCGQGGRRVVDLNFGLHGGDDYELLFTSSRPVPPEVEGVSITKIGRTTRSAGMRLVDAGGNRTVLKPGGWEHFQGDL
jgi:thiamine-monophosphate kinase